MTLYEYINLCANGAEIEIEDCNYHTFDAKAYFCKDDNNKSKYYKSMLKLSKTLTVKEINETIITVNLSELINESMDNLKSANLFDNYHVGDIMNEMSTFLSMYVDDDWLMKFVNALMD